MSYCYWEELREKWGVPFSQPFYFNLVNLCLLLPLVVVICEKCPHMLGSHQPEIKHQSIVFSFLRLTLFNWWVLWPNLSSSETLPPLQQIINKVTWEAPREDQGEVRQQDMEGNAPHLEPESQRWVSTKQPPTGCRIHPGSMVTSMTRLPFFWWIRVIHLSR